MERFEDLVNDLEIAVEDYTDEVAGGGDADVLEKAETYVREARTNLLNAIRELL